jgi:hypothetical protein
MQISSHLQRVAAFLGHLQTLFVDHHQRGMDSMRVLDQNLEILRTFKTTV